MTRFSTVRSACLGLCAAVAVILITGTPARADETPRTLRLTGTGSVSARPDMATLSLGVVTNGDTAKTALSRNSAAMTNVFRVLETNEIPGRDVQTSGFSVRPVFKRQPRGASSGDTAPEIIGYTVRNGVTVSVRNLERVGTLIDALVEDGANEFRGLSFGFADPEPLMDGARRAAAADVRRKAALYAEAMDVTLGPIRSINEQSSGRPRAMSAGLMRTEAAVPVAAGESELSMTLSVVYELVE
ncbi:MAG: SIMPL domain-containing protein [Alphaproteobacteria bacterium]